MAYGFDPAQRTAWLEPLTAERRAGALCRRHADAMAVPRGWWLDDRRAEPSQLFVPPATTAASTPTLARAPVPPRRPLATPAPSLLDDESAGGEPGEPAGPVLPDPTPAWSPIDVARSEPDSVLDAATPLLARAFGRPTGTGRPPEAAAG